MTKLSFVRQVTVATLSVLLCSNLWAASSDTLAPRQRAIVAIAAHTANGDLTALERNLVEGLQAGLTVNEIKEVLIQLYAYTGFPRSLNAIHTFMRLMDERTKAGINDPDGKEPSPIPVNLNKDEYGVKVRAKLGGRTEIPPPSGYQLFAPGIDTFLKEHLFCDIFIRDNLDAQSRELATIGALGGMTGTAGQMNFHFNAAMNTGTTAEQMRDFVKVIEMEIGADYAKTAQGVLNKVLTKRSANAK